ncbi:mTERF-domain-containing protein [Baffinella frigidus]|nr:mTERF-domain-containing protein [Cryptophyta sp. CCMP2293]|mmetsp:Transcript_61283/g.140265  ORF Transcript_61283/g.140265 Transcript_61283/m.140265 type:complete len:698 (-) Transcript_61283:68-2161(-)
MTMARGIGGRACQCTLQILALAIPCSSWIPTVGVAHVRLPGRALGARAALRCAERAGEVRVCGARMAAGAGVRGLPDGGEVWRQEAVRQDRENLNNQVMAREAQEAGLRRRIRASSYDLGGLDVRRFFAQYDVDKNGALSASEFARLAVQTGSRAASPEDLRAILQVVGSNNEVRMRDFLRWMGVPISDDSKASRSMSGPARSAVASTPPVGGDVTPPGAWSYGDSTSAVEPAGAWTFGESSLGEGMLNAGAKGEKLSGLSATLEKLKAAQRNFQALRGSVAGPSSTSRGASAAERFRRSAVPSGMRADAGVTEAAGSREPMEELLRLVAPWVDAPAQQLRDVIYMLVSELGVPEEKVVGLAIAAPAFFKHNVEAELRPSLERLLDCGIRKSRLATLILAHPEVVEAGAARLDTVSAFLVSLGLTEDKVGKVVASNPQMLGLSVEGNLNPTVDFLVVEGGVPRRSVGQLVAQFPNVVSYSVKHKLRPMLAFLRDELGVPAEGLGALLQKYPQILSLSIDNNLRPTVLFLREAVGVDFEGMARMVQQHPQMLGLSIEANLQPKMRYLTERLGIAPARLLPIITALPTLLSLSIEKNLEPKVRFLVDEAGYSKDDIAKSPNLLAYSLEKRMRPRHEALSRMGVRMALGSMLSYSEEAFQRKFGFRDTLALATAKSRATAAKPAPEARKPLRSLVQVEQA